MGCQMGNKIRNIGDCLVLYGFLYAYICLIVSILMAASIPPFVHYEDVAILILNVFLLTGIPSLLIGLIIHLVPTKPNGNTVS